MHRNNGIIAGQNVVIPGLLPVARCVNSKVFEKAEKKNIRKRDRTITQ